jgi:hypothetical protein
MCSLDKRIGLFGRGDGKAAWRGLTSTTQKLSKKQKYETTYGGMKTSDERVS